MTPSLITGPSHAHRLRNCIRTGQLHKPLAEIVGVGGMPIWSQRITPYLDHHHSCFHIVGDFRFGNRILKESNSANEIACSEREYFAIDKELISSENDRIMFEAANIAIDRILNKQNCNSRFLFWDLTIREFESASNQKYITNGQYKHPTWNLHSTLNQHKTAVDSTDLLYNAKPFYIDSSAHPSLIGWSYIFDRIFDSNRSASELLSLAHTSFNMIFDCVKIDAADFDDIYIVGNSKFVRLLSSFKEKGVIALPDWIKIIPSDNVKCKPNSKCLLFPSLIKFKSEINFKDETFTKYLNYRNDLIANKCDVSVILYDNWATQNVYKRPQFINKYDQYSIISTSLLENILCPRAQKYCISQSTQWGGMIELLDSLIPTTFGMMEILIRSITGKNKEYSDFYYNQLLLHIFDNHRFI